MSAYRFPGLRGRGLPGWTTGLLVLILLLLPVAGALAGGLSAEADRSRLAADETLRLRVVADGDLSGDPDLSPLSRDFEIIASSSGTSTTIVVNGGVSTSRSWVLDLAPRRAGALEIPALTLGGERTAPIPIQVLPAGGRGAAAGGPGPIFLDTEVADDSPFVQQGFLYRVKVLFREQPRGPTLSEPVADGATIDQVGSDQSYSEMVEGQRYQVIERRYWVIPQKSGPLTIHSPRLEARLADNRPGARRSPFADFEELMGGRLFQGFPNMPDIGGGRRVVERGPDQSLEVRPQPADAPSPWLPAQSLELTDEWSASPPRFKVGEPVTRTLTLTARGLTAAQLPTLDVGEPQGVNVYPDAPQTEDLPGEVPVSLKSLKVALVPTRAGALTLPEIRVPWWDTETDQARVTVIPQRTVQVVAAPGAVPQQMPTPLQGPAVGAAGASPGAPESMAASPPAGSGSEPGTPEAAGWSEPPGPWPWVALVLGLGWLASLVWIVVDRRRAHPPATVQSEATSTGRIASMNKAARALASACAAGDPKAARTALLDWGRARWGRDAPKGLGELGARLGGDDIRACLDGIDQAIYARDGGDWDGAGAGRLLRGALDIASDRRGVRSQQPLPGLYPQRV